MIIYVVFYFSFLPLLCFLVGHLMQTCGVAINALHGKRCGMCAPKVPKCVFDWALVMILCGLGEWFNHNDEVAGIFSNMHEVWVCHANPKNG